MADVSINGKPLASLSAWIYASDTVRDLTPRKYPTAGVYGRGGVVPGAPEIGARAVRLTGRIVTTANTVAARAAAEHAFRDHVGNGGLVTVVVDEGTSPDMAADALVERLTFTPIGHPLQAVASEWQLDLLVPSATWRDAAGHLAVAVPATATRYSLPLGTAPSSPRLVVLGSATTPTVTIRDSGGTAQVTLVLGTLASTETLELDCEAGTITKYASGTASNGISLLTSGTFPFRVDPAWGDYAAARWPTIETSAGQAEVLYVKRYW